MPIILVVPTLLQMVWIESPPYFCTASETGRDVAEQYVETAIGSLPTHKFQVLTDLNPDFGALPEEYISNDCFHYMIQVYMDYYIALAMGRIRAKLRHIETGVMTDIYDVSPQDGKDKEDPIFLKKIFK